MPVFDDDQDVVFTKIPVEEPNLQCLMIKTTFPKLLSRDVSA
jgi:hypothetical protein